jgi:hypothetical protein
MSRPKPKVLLTYTDKKYHAHEALDTAAIYVIFYKGAPVCLRRRETLRDSPGPKYPRIAFGSRKICQNAAAKLNKMHRCNDFTVVRVTADGLG